MRGFRRISVAAKIEYLGDLGLLRAGRVEPHRNRIRATSVSIRSSGSLLAVGGTLSNPGAEEATEFVQLIQVLYWINDYAASPPGSWFR